MLLEIKMLRCHRRALASGCMAHALHDGFTDLIYVLLPIWQAQFGISYAMAGLMRGLYSGVMAGLQMPASRLAKRWGRKTVLVLGTGLAALGYLVAGHAGSLIGVGAALALAGMGSSTQHPLAAALVAEMHDGQRSRQALATYNFAGDIGKMLLPALVALSLTWLNWPQSVMLVGCLGVVAALTLAWLIPSTPVPDLVIEASPVPMASPTESDGRIRFAALLLTGLIDSATRMGFLTFLPFILKEKGASTITIGIALSVLFVGGAAGKLVCGTLGTWFGMMKTVWLTELGTALLIMAILLLPLPTALALLPILGVVLNGTSSVLYGTVPELVPSGRREHAFALFYTGTIGGGAVSPLIFGAIGDEIGVPQAMQGVAGMVLMTLPLAWLIDRALRSRNTRGNAQS